MSGVGQRGLLGDLVSRWEKRNGEVVLTYKTSDGATMSGVHNPSNDTIDFTSDRGFKATWRRRR